ncbi:AraC family transcriptional regulator [Nocardiopsis sp. CC223A]|uniref:helix-turn-helix domain-containing protein n=1 Tax=Nocardiopsis sp. CC223A TaxID=3044051 RepID=UPI00278BCC12|nr:AraC family transcriptional regulator [Nocardiopsis sp. CC223A]
MVIRDVLPGADPGFDNRRLPVYEAGEIDVPFVVRGSDEVIARDTFWEEHAHPTHELLWNERGASSAAVGARVWTITPTVGLWIPAGVRHSGWTPAGTWHRAAHFGVHAVPAIADRPVAVEVTPLLRLLLERLDHEDLSGDERTRTEAMVLDLIAPARNEILLQVPESPLLAPIVAAVLENPADTTTLAAWAARLGVSSRTLTRAFRAETGLGFSRWVTTARVRHAISLLSHGEDIEEVAVRVGYHSVSAFGTAFRRITGTSPGRFRDR